MSELSIALRTAGSGLPRPTAAKDDTKPSSLYRFGAGRGCRRAEGAPVRERRGSGDDGRRGVWRAHLIHHGFAIPTIAKRRAIVPCSEDQRMDFIFVGSLIFALLRALGMAFAMAWEILWP